MPKRLSKLAGIASSLIMTPWRMISPAAVVAGGGTFDSRAFGSSENPEQVKGSDRQICGWNQMVITFGRIRLVRPPDTKLKLLNTFGRIELKNKSSNFSLPHSTFTKGIFPTYLHPISFQKILVEKIGTEKISHWLRPSPEKPENWRMEDLVLKWKSHSKKWIALASLNKIRSELHLGRAM